MVGLRATGDDAKAKRRWSVVVSKAGQERIAKLRLEQQGFPVYLPMMIEDAPRSKRRPAGDKIVRPFLPRHLFVQVDPRVDRWRCIFSTVGVSSILLSGELPGVVPDKVIERIRAEEEGDLIRIVDPGSLATPYENGDRCKVRIGGKGGEVDALFIERVDEKRVAVLVSLLGAASRQEVPLLSLR